MEKISQIVKAVFDRGLFDQEWYSRAYPDVSALNMEPAHHYRHYGSVMGRAPAAEFAKDPRQLEVLLLAKPTEKMELRRAHEIALHGDHELAISFAQAHLPDDLAYTIETLHANAALTQQDEESWLRHINAFIDHFGAAPVHLQEGASLIERFCSGTLPAVTGGPLISIIMPAWNAENTIRAAANSVLAQSWRNLELLIVDDASQDGTWGVMQEIAASDARAKIFRNKINVGPYVAKNIAVSMSKGEWITGHDADDWAHPQRIERHMNEILGSPVPPRASVPYMLRFDPDGSLSRFSVRGKHSPDGICRLASIACTFDSKFLREELGGWDCIRFGADSEIMGRSIALLGDEFRNINIISMLCLDLDSSLTNHPTLGVDRSTGPSQPRMDYSKAWQKWHSSFADSPSAARMEFPPTSETSRPAEVSGVPRVPLCDIRRNYAAVTGKDSAFGEAVTAICSSKRPFFLEHVARQICAQTHDNLHLIYIAHGPGHDLEKISQAFKSLASVKVIALPDTTAVLGEALNLALDRCQTDLVTKVDDDDFYGPEYIRSSIAALKYNGHNGVGIVGRASAYCFAEDRDLLALRFPEGSSNQIKKRVFGGTIFWSRSRLNDQRFQPLPKAVDSAFFADAVAQGVKIYSCEPYDYVHIRYAQASEHTWKIDTDEFLSKAAPICNGLRLDLAFSTQARPEVSEIPKHKPAGLDHGARSP